MNPEAFQEWKSLFDSGIAEVWKSERQELKRAAMVFFALKKEFQRLQNGIDKEMNSFREKLSQCDKEISQEDIIDKEEYDLRSPELFCMKNYLPSNNDSTFMNEDETFLTQKDPDISPKMNKSSLIRKQHKLKTIHQKNLQNSFSSEFKDNSNLNSTVDISVDKDCTPKRILNKNVDVLELSIIENTPDAVPLQKTNVLKMFSFPGKRRRRGKGSNNDLNGSRKYNTLTQMFNSIAQESTNCSNPSDESFLLKNQTSASSMAIDDILDHINKAEDKCISSSSLENDDEEKYLECGLLRFTGMCSDDTDTESNNKVSSKVNVKYHESPQKTTHKLLSKENTSPNYVYKPEPVRGKARKKLKGWACRECKEFYEAMELSEEEVQKRMDACSKHRGKFAPAYETPPGFWSLTMPHSKN